MLSLEEKKIRHKESNRKSREKNKEKRAEYQKKYDVLNKEKIAARKKEYWKLNGERLTEHRNTEEYKKYRREYRKLRISQDTQYRLHGQLKYLYGITIKEYNDLFSKQEGRCAICGIRQAMFKKRLHVDHCHKTGNVRGLLCTNCNTAIGKLKDSPEIMQRAIDYLKQPGGINDPARGEPCLST